MVAANFRGGLTAQVDWLGLRAGMLTGPAGMRPRPRPERMRPRTKPRPKNFFEAEARHVTEQLSVYENED